MSRILRCLAALVIVHCLVALGGCDWLVSADKRIASAERRIASGDDRGAAIDLQNALKSEPENVPAHLLMAQISLRMGEPKSAEKDLQLATQHGATPEQTHALVAQTRIALREFNQLLSLIDSGELKLSEADLATYRGLALLGMNDADKAGESFNKAIALDANASRARIGLAEVLSVQGKSAESLQQLQAALATNPNDATAALLQGRVLARRGDYRPAIQSLKSAREHAASQLSVGQYAMMLATLTEAQLAVGDLTGAQETHKELAARAPSSPLTGLLAARLAMVKQDYTNAVAEAQKVVTRVPDMVGAKMLLGAALLAQGNLNQAATVLEDVVRLSPENLEARKLLARAHLQLQRPDIAMQVLSQVQQGETADPQLDALLGWANLQRGDDAAAIALLERSVAAQPNNANLKLDLAMAYVSGGQHDKAAGILRAVPATPGQTRRESLLLTAIAASKGMDAAQAEIDRMIATSPSDAALLKLAGAFYARQGDVARARSLLARAVAEQPKDVATLLSQARLEIAAGDAKASTDAVAKALAIEPANMTARMMQVEISARSGDLAAAGKQLEEIRASDATAIGPRLVLARLYMQQKKTREAEDLIRELRVRAENDATTANELGRFYLDAGRFEEALTWFRVASRKDPANSSYGLSVARAQIALGDNGAARESLSALLAAHPGSVEANTALVMLDLREGRREVAASRAAELKKAHPENASVAMLEGDVAMNAKSYKDAAQAYATASKLAPSGALAVRAYRANQLGGLPDATAPLESWLKRQPKDMATRMVLAEAYASDGRLDRAIEQYEQTIAANRPNAMALNNLAWLYHQTGDDRAAATARRAYELSPQTPAISDTYGWILVKAGDVAKGLPILRKAATVANAHPDIRYHYAVALAQAGQRDAARRELIEITSDKPDFASIAEAQKLLAELGG